MPEEATRASQAVNLLRASAFGLQTRTGRPMTSEVRAQLKTANECLLDADKAIQAKDAERLKLALQKFHEIYDTVKKATPPTIH